VPVSSSSVELRDREVAEGARICSVAGGDHMPLVVHRHGMRGVTAERRRRVDDAIFLLVLPANCFGVLSTTRRLSATIGDKESRNSSRSSDTTPLGKRSASRFRNIGLARCRT
jgi:hypothetical protein